MKHFGSITEINGAEIEPVDCITGGSPCQDLSIAGKRAGLAGERSGLFMEQIRVIKEMRANDRRNGKADEFIRPRWMVWENVPGAFSSNNGEDFRAVLEETAKIADETAAIPRPPKGKWTPAGCIMGDGWSIAWRVHDAQFWGVPQRRKRIALVADFRGTGAPEILFERKGLSGDSETGRTEREEAAGNVRESVAQASRDYQLTCYGISSYESNAMKSDNPHSGIYEADTARTLDNNGGNPACNQGGMIIYDARGNGDGNICPTITGDHQDRVTDYTAICIGNGQVNQVQVSDKAGALNCMHDQQAIITYGIDRAAFNQGQSIVRRLTPLECERLQGYPDGWTDIGEWTDSKGKKHKDADSPRYKALGNSIALPFWFWLLRRISATYCRPATLGSLFDGLGGFPLCWERSNGKGTARWASEIEEFCIAVTKRHFEEDNHD